MYTKKFSEYLLTDWKTRYKLMREGIIWYIE